MRQHSCSTALCDTALLYISRRAPQCSVKVDFTCTDQRRGTHRQTCKVPSAATKSPVQVVNIKSAVKFAASDLRAN